MILLELKLTLTRLVKNSIPFDYIKLLLKLMINAKSASLSIIKQNWNSLLEVP
jgi:hypothetical protein